MHGLIGLCQHIYIFTKIIEDYLVFKYCNRYGEIVFCKYKAACLNNDDR